MLDDLIESLAPGVDDVTKAKIKNRIRQVFGIATKPGPAPTPMPIGAGGMPWWAIALIAYIVVEK